MKLATFITGDASELGAVIGQKIVPLNRVLPQLPADMIGLIQSWPAVEAAVRAAADAAAVTLDLDQVRLLAPIPPSFPDPRFPTRQNSRTALPAWPPGFVGPWRRRSRQASPTHQPLRGCY